MARVSLDNFARPSFAVVDSTGSVCARESSYEEGLERVAYEANRAGAVAFVDGNATPRTNPADGGGEAALTDARAALRASRIPPSKGAWEGMAWKKARKTLMDSAREFYPEILEATAPGTEHAVHRGRKGGISGKLSASWFNPRANLGIMRENQKTKKVLSDSSIQYASRGVSFLPHFAGFKSPFDISLDPLPGNPTFCLGSVPECRQTCLVFTGQRKMESGAYASSWLFSKLLQRHPDELLCWMRESMLTWCEKASDVRLFFRLNVFSDIPWELYAPGYVENVVESLRDIHGLPAEPESGWMLYDYSKLRGRPGIENVYDITFSFTGYKQNTSEFVSILNDEPGVAKRCAAVFLKDEGGWYQKEPGKALRKYVAEGRDDEEDLYYPFTFFDHPVFNGDKSDIRALDPEDVRVVGLRYKPSKYKVLSEEGKTFGMKDFVPPEELDSRMRMFLVRVIQPDPEAPPVVCATQDASNRTYLPLLDTAEDD